MTPVVRNFLVLSFACIGLTAPVRRAEAAVGTVDLSWSACSPVVASLSRGAPGPISMYASVVGHDEPHTGYSFTVYVVPTPGSAVPDAWRFDAAGCQGTDRVELHYFPMGAISKACPAFQ